MKVYRQIFLWLLFITVSSAYITWTLTALTPDMLVWAAIALLPLAALIYHQWRCYSAQAEAMDRANHSPTVEWTSNGSTNPLPVAITELIYPDWLNKLPRKRWWFVGLGWGLLVLIVITASHSFWTRNILPYAVWSLPVALLIGLTYEVHFFTIAKTLILASSPISREKQVYVAGNGQFIAGVTAQLTILGKWLATLYSLRQDYLLLAVLRAELMIALGGGWGELPPSWGGQRQIQGVLLACMFVVIFTILEASFSAALGLVAATISRNRMRSIILSMLMRGSVVIISVALSWPFLASSWLELQGYTYNRSFSYLMLAVGDNGTLVSGWVSAGIPIADFDLALLAALLGILLFIGMTCLLLKVAERIIGTDRGSHDSWKDNQVIPTDVIIAQTVNPKRRSQQAAWTVLLVLVIEIFGVLIAKNALEEMILPTYPNAKKVIFPTTYVNAISFDQCMIPATITVFPFRHEGWNFNLTTCSVTLDKWEQIREWYKNLGWIESGYGLGVSKFSEWNFGLVELQCVERLFIFDHRPNLPTTISGDARCSVYSAWLHRQP